MKSPSEWIEILAKHQNRQYYRDQTPESLGILIDLARGFVPDIIVELGTCFGLSLRAWIAADTDARITAIDSTFKHLRDGLKVLPLDLSKIKIDLIEKDIEGIFFPALWGNDSKVLLYCDVHGGQLMGHILNHAVTILPSGSLVVIDDVWYSEIRLDETTARRFFDDVVSQQTDPNIGREHQPRYFADYWQSGSLFGFEEVPTICEYLNEQRIGAKMKSKVLWFSI
uniref:Putative glycosyltransferase n=1 Tax=viral metagenome TaxID=1070528 RepID=A0A6M3ITL7_9ZZZZ